MRIEANARQRLDLRIAELQIEQSKLTPNPDRVALLKAKIDELRALLFGY